MKRTATAAFLLTVLTCFTSPANHAQAHQRPRLRIGVALSGGGALGLAHIGVLRYFEEHHIPIDDLAGTSMGGLVGGLYATGMDAEQITHVVEHADWDALLNPNARFIDQPVADKQSWNRTSGRATLQFGKGLALPRGLNSGEALSLLFSRSTLSYSDLRSFDDLPIPFRCVATDLVSGRAVVLQSGSLPLAMRATMSIPGIFTPVRWGDMVLADGGLVQTVPVETVRDMGAEIVIAVAFEPRQVKAEQMKSLPDIMRRTAFISTYQNEQRSLARADNIVLINPKEYSAIDYGKWAGIIQAGYEAAARVSAQLEKFEVSQSEWQQYRDSRAVRMRPPIAQGKVVSVEAPAVPFRRNAPEEINRKLDSRSVPPRQLEDVLTGIAAATGVPSVTYGWQDGIGKPEGYKVTISERSGDQVLIRPSFQFRSSPGEPDQAALRISTAIMFQNAYKSRLLGTLNIGYDPGMHIEYYHPFHGSQYFIAPSFFVERFHVNSYQGPERTGQSRDRVGGAIYGGIGTWRFAQLRAGVQAGYDFYEGSPTVDGVKAISGSFVNPELRWIFNSQDSGGLPTRGILTEGTAGYSFREVDYPYFEHLFSVFHPVGNLVSLFAMSRQASSFGRKLDYFEQFNAGGQGQLGAFRYQEFHANTLATTGGGFVLHPHSPRHHMQPDFATWYEAGRFDQGSEGWNTHQSTSAGFFFPTAIGALGTTLSFDENGRARWRFLLGSL
jgi:NTE family protein